MIKFGVGSSFGIFLSCACMASTEVKSFETKKPICIQNGPSMIKSIGASYARENTLKRAIKDGQVQIPAGCKVEVETSRELMGTETEAEQAALMFVSFVGCEEKEKIKIGSEHFFGAVFDTKGCLEGAFNSTELNVCGKTLPEGQRLNFKNGLLDCSGRTKKLPD